MNNSISLTKQNHRSLKWLLLMITMVIAVFVIFTPTYADGPVMRQVSLNGVDIGDCTGTPCATINYAIGQANSGDTVQVDAGLYREHVVINKSVFVQGSGAGVPVLDGDLDGDSIPDGNVVLLNAVQAALSGFEIRHGFNGVIVENASMSIVEQNIIHDNFHPNGSGGIGVILTGGSQFISIQGNEIFHNDAQGVWVGATNPGAAPYANIVGYNNIYANGINRVSQPETHEIGVTVINSDGNLVMYNNIFDHNQTASGAGVSVERAKGNGIIDNDLYQNQHGIHLGNRTRDNYLADNRLFENAQNGVYVTGRDNQRNLVSYNQFCRNGNYAFNNEAYPGRSIRIDATHNWWGSASGPGEDGPGVGNNISHGLVFEPWDMAPPSSGPCHINSLQVHKYGDLNQNGSKDAGEAGLNGWIMTLYDQQGQMLMTDTTHHVNGEEGWALFEFIQDGIYTVCETAKGGWAGTEPVCQTLPVGYHGKLPGTGPLFMFYDHPGDDMYRFQYFGLDIWGLTPDDFDELNLLERVSEPWLCVASHLQQTDPDTIAEIILGDQAGLNPYALIPLDLSAGFQNDRYDIMVENEHFTQPVQLGVRTWRGYEYSTATAYIECDWVPTLTFGGYTANPLLYISTDGSGHINYYDAYADNDILVFDMMRSSWDLYFDGSDVGLRRTDIDALHMMDDGSILMSFRSPVRIRRLGKVDDADIVRFVPTQLGDRTRGSFEWYLDGSDVGLSHRDENIDAIGFAPDGRLTISTLSDYTVNGAVGPLSGNNRDVLVFNMTSLGRATSGTWEKYLNSDDLTDSIPNIVGLWNDPVTGEMRISVDDLFAVTGAAGDYQDVVSCQPVGAMSDCAFGPGLYWDGSLNGMEYSRRIDAMTIGN